MAHKILVNSRFTRSIFKNAFRLLRTEPDILYPCLIEKGFELPKEFDTQQALYDMLGLKNGQKMPRIVTSLNRYERKKNIGLAIKAFREFKTTTKSTDTHMLVIAGGYDDAVLENVEHYEELQALAEGLDNVVFLRSISNEQRLTLLTHSEVLLYTPENEHFGIVPVEAMYMGCIVLACNSGGPTESLVHEQTGYLLTADDIPAWADKLNQLLSQSPDSSLNRQIIKNSKQRVIDTFSFEQFSNTLVDVVSA